MIRLREYSKDDYEQVYRLWENSGPGVGIGRSDSRPEIAKKLERDPDLFIIAEDGNQVIGTVIGGFDGRRGVIYHLAVQQDYRRHGIGKLLMDEIERRLVAKGCIRSYLLVKPEAEDVLAFYQELGWDVTPNRLLAKNIG